MKKVLSTFLMIMLAMGMAQAQAVAFQEDFHNGIPATWYNGGTSGGVANSYVKFVRRTSQTQGSPYGYTNSLGVITSPTRSNGYISFNSDSLDGGSTGAQGTGPAPSPQSVTLALPRIPVAGYNKLNLEFYQYLATYGTTTYVDISNDSSTWVTDTLNATLGTNGTTALADEKVNIDVSSITSGQNYLYIRFRADADYYFWNIDDIKVYELPNNDLKVTSDYGVSGYSGLNLFFQSYPLSQSDSVSPVVRYKNVGGKDQPNAKATINLIKNGAQINTYTTTPPVAVLGYGLDTVDYATFPTTGLGNYKASMTVSSDSTDYYAPDNTDTLTFAVTDSVYSISKSNAISGGFYALRNAYALDLRYGTLFEVVASDTVTSVTTAVSGGTKGTKAGAVIGADIYQMTVGSTLTYSTAVVSTEKKTLTNADISGNTLVPVTLRIDNSTGNAVLAPGLYWVAIKAISTPDSCVIFTTTAKSRQGMISINEDLSQPGTLQGYSNSDAVYCNLNFGRASSLLAAGISRVPGVSPLRANQPVAFTGTAYNGSNASTYAWTFTGSPYLGYTYAPQSGKTVRDTFPAADTITVCLTVSDGGNSASTCITVRVKDDGVGVEEISPLSQTSLKPNPTTGNVTISASDVTGALSISIINMIGEEVKQYNETANGSFVKNYNLSDLSSGVYIVKLLNGNNTATKRLSISK